MGGATFTSNAEISGVEAVAKRKQQERQAKEAKAAEREFKRKRNAEKKGAQKARQLGKRLTVENEEESAFQLFKDKCESTRSAADNSRGHPREVARQRCGHVVRVG